MQGQGLPVSATFFFVVDRPEAGMKNPLLPDTDRPQDLSDHGGMEEAVEKSEACRLLEAWKQEAVCNWYESRKTFKCMALAVNLFMRLSCETDAKYLLSGAKKI